MHTTFKRAAEIAKTDPARAYDIIEAHEAGQKTAGVLKTASLANLSDHVAVFASSAANLVERRLNARRKSWEEFDPCAFEFVYPEFRFVINCMEYNDIGVGVHTNDRESDEIFGQKYDSQTGYAKIATDVVAAIQSYKASREAVAPEGVLG